MKILIIGGGGREHALAWKAAQATPVEIVYVTPGNAGTAGEAGVENVAIGAEDIPALLEFADDHRIDLTIVGPEAPLVAGIVDRFQARGLRCFGPRAAAAQLEGSKSFAKAFLTRHHIPTARWAGFEDADAAAQYIRERGAPIVVKADGLAAGKGVIVAACVDDAIGAARDMLAAGRFGPAGRSIVVEECLRGEEASFMAIVAGEQVLPLATSQDHKARDDGDRGPNTGGMGAYSPAPVIDPALHQRIVDEIIQPTVRALAAEGTPYTGFLYAGLMIGADGAPRVLEYNCRFGDPETQPVLMRLRTDLPALCEAALDGRLDEVEALWDPRPALGVVMAAGGYPGRYRTGDPIEGLNGIDDPQVKVFHAGTTRPNDQVLTCGGRVLCVTALGEDLAAAHARAYAAVEKIHWADACYRHDIGHRALARVGDPGRGV